jgi:hypothetical protein
VSERIAYRVCRCGQQVLILNTRRGKRIAINTEPKGREAFKFRDWLRHETYYVPREHQPHFLTCTKPRERHDERRRFV